MVYTSPMQKENEPTSLVILTALDVPRGGLFVSRQPEPSERLAAERLAAWFEVQVGGPLEGQWVAVEESSDVDAVRVLDSDSELSALHTRMFSQGRLHQGVHIGRMTCVSKGDTDE